MSLQIGISIYWIQGILRANKTGLIAYVLKERKRQRKRGRQGGREEGKEGEREGRKEERDRGREGGREEGKKEGGGRKNQSILGGELAVVFLSH